MTGPNGSHGTMTPADWRSVIDQAADLGVSAVQFIGGEPTTHPQFPDLLDYAVAAGLDVEVYTNLMRVKDPWWELFARPNVSLATSYYSDPAAEHDEVPGGAAATPGRWRTSGRQSAGESRCAPGS